ncbi:conjugal transfer protein [Streptantibioticus parmotrematis]|uniref:conjugal transfer protein n=1 Tax=Streptantibioticus parmotrematis TaxID=2873249 RepID=UPI0033D574AF
MWRSKKRERAAESVVGADEWEGGWAHQPSTGAVANTSWLLRNVAWLLLFSGPFLGGAALLSEVLPAAYAAPVTQPRPATSTRSADAVGPSGFADLYVDAFVAAGQGSEQQLAGFYPAAAQLTLSGKPGAEHATDTAAVRVQQVSSGYWAVTVATQVTGSGTPAAGGSASTAASAGSVTAPAGTGLRYFQVPVRASGSGFVAAALPAEVSAPAASGSSAPLAYGQANPPVTGDPATGTLSEFLNAYLTGNGDLTRDLSPGTVIAPVTPAPYARVSVTQVAQAGGSGDASANSTTVPADGTRRQLLVDVDATDSSVAVRPLTYAVELKARAGRWEVDQLQAAPLLSSDQTAGTSMNGAGQ